MECFIGIERQWLELRVFLGVAQTIVGSPCNVVWAFFSVFSIFCITSFGDCNRPQHQENTGISDPVLVRSIPQAEPGADLEGRCRGCAPPPPRDDLRFSNTTGILQKKLCGLLVLK